MGKENFTKAAGKANAHVKEFSQLMYILRHGGDQQDQKGVCRGLTAAFLWREKKNVLAENAALVAGTQDQFAPKLFFSYFKDDMGQPNARGTKWFGRVKGVQAKYHKGGKLEEADVIKAVANTVEDLSRRHLAYKSYETVWKGNIKAKQIEVPGYYYISAGEHAMALTARKLNNVHSYLFFDPNYGRAAFNDEAKLLAFLSEYLPAEGYDYTFFIKFQA